MAAAKNKTFLYLTLPLTILVAAGAYCGIFLNGTYALSDIIPAIAEHKIPKSLIGTGMLTNPIQVLDISLLLPGMIITSIFLLKQKPVGYLFTPVALGFCVLMSLNISVLTIFMKLKGISDTLTVAEIMGIFVVCGIILLFILFRHLKKGNAKI